MLNNRKLALPCAERAEHRKDGAHFKKCLAQTNNDVRMGFYLHAYGSCFFSRMTERHLMDCQITDRACVDTRSIGLRKARGLGALAFELA